MARRADPIRRAAQPVPGSEKQLVSAHLLRPLDGLLQTLRDAREHGNRKVFADYLLVAHLVAFFSPALKSLRRIEDVFEHPAAQRRYGLPRLPRSTLSDAQAVFDPALLTALVAELKARVGPSPHDPRLDELTTRLLAVDGSFFAMAARVAWALYNKPHATPRQPAPKRRRGNVRVDFHFDVLAGVPEAAFVCGGRTPEYATLMAHLQAEAFYVVDRGYHCYQMIADILVVGSDVLVRLRDDMKFTVVSAAPLSAADRLAGVVACQTVRACGARGEKALGDRLLRLVILRGPDGQLVRLLTNRLDLAADLLGLVYRHRWQIELFFRWLKCLVNFRHFFAESENGVAWQIAAALIGILLLALATGEQPNSYDWALMTHVMSGLLPADRDFDRILARRRAERTRAAAWQKEYRARQKKSD